MCKVKLNKKNTKSVANFFINFLSSYDNKNEQKCLYISNQLLDYFATYLQFSIKLVTFRNIDGEFKKKI